MIDVGSGDPILLLHGFPLAAEHWSGIVSSLQDEFRVLAPDFPGAGDAELTSFTLSSIASEICQQLEQRNISSAHVVGFSFGGYVLNEMLAQDADRVRTAVFISSRCRADDESEQRARQDQIEALKAQGTAPFIDGYLEALFDGPYPSKVRVLMERLSLEGYIQYIAAIGARRDHCDTIQAYRGRCAIFAGDQDKIIPLSDMKIIDGLAENSRFELFPGAGHMLIDEVPKALTEKLRNLFRDRF